MTVRLPVRCSKVSGPMNSVAFFVMMTCTLQCCLTRAGGQGRGLIAGDAARDAQQHGFSLSAWEFLDSAREGILPG